MPLLQLDQIVKVYRGRDGGQVRAVDGLTLALEPGEFLAVQGPSGCGKTTVLLMAGGLLEPTEGRVHWNGQDPYALDANRRARARAETAGFVFQQFHLVPYLSVLDNVRAAAVATGLPDAQARAETLVAQFGLGHRRQHVPGELSTGERQRTALARALLNQPRLLLADEPTGNLDRENADIVMHALAAFARGGGAVLLVSHDERAVQHATRVVQLRSGRAE